ncbi:MAG: hypothetical protein KA205_05520 [Acidobacteria bacterium]|nr:hypothetical protein [Acidobacteriota bacterium]
MRWAVRAILILTSTVVSCLIVEGGVRAYLAVRPLPVAPSELPIVSTPAPLPYRNASYYNEAFLRETLAVRLRDTLEPYPLLVDMPGPAITIIDGRRRTMEQPAMPAHRVHVFGGSTIVGVEVPDEWTVPSRLQHELNARCAAPVAVDNQGVISITSTYQQRRLAELAVAAGDVVVFYDGVNDVYQSVLQGFRDDEVMAQARVDASSEPLLWRTMRPVLRHSAVWALLANWRQFPPRPPRTVSQSSILAANVQAAAARLSEAAQAANAWSTGRGAAFVHVLQPHLFATPLDNAYRRALAADRTVVPVGLDTAFAAAYPAFRDALARVPTPGAMMDLSAALPVTSEDDDVFLDFCHLNHVGNARIARLIADEIVGRWPDCATRVR